MSKFRIKLSGLWSSRARKKEPISKIVSRLFDEASNKPCGLDRFLHLVEKDHERHAKDYKNFEKKLRQFDENNDLLPIDYVP